MSECAVAVADALPALKERAAFVTSGAADAGVVELIEELVRDDLQAARARIPHDSRRYELPAPDSRRQVLGAVGLSAAAALGVNPRTFAMGIALAASCSFITPLEPSCMLVYGPGRYQFSDFFRLGGPLTALMLVVLLVLVPWAWPMEAHGPSIGAGRERGK